MSFFKLNIPKLTLLFLFIAISGFVKGQMTQFHIGGPGNEMATRVRFIPADTSTIIAGYSYNIVAGAARNCQAIVMKVKSNGTIAWQKTFGVPLRNNIIKDMIITQDNNIVVVGTVGGNGDIYSDNTAAILKYNSVNGNLMWQSCFRDVATTSGGELFYGVTELTDGTNRLVAVGAHNLTGPGAGSLICVYQSTGTMIYNEVFDVGSGDEFQGVVTSTAGNSVYICGEFVSNFKDGRVLSYTPGATSGVVNWARYFDFSLFGTLNNNFFSRIYLSGTRLVVLGGNLQGYSTAFGSGESVLTLNAADGLGAQLYGIKNSGAAYCNEPAIAVASADHIFSIQSPSSAYYDATIYMTGVSTSAVITDITSLSAGTSNTPIRYTSTDVGLHSILDLQLQGSELYFAGATNVTSGFGNNDVYYVNTSTSFSSLNLTCDTAHDNVAITFPAFTSAPPVVNIFTFTPTYSTVDTGTTNFDIGILCGDLALPDSGCNILTMPDTITACANSNVVMPATVAGVDSVFSYLWTPATGLSSSTVLNPTLAVTTSGWYYQTIVSQLPGSFITNGDFTAGNTGFTTGYTLDVPGPVLLPGNYAVTNTPSLYDFSFIPFGDHTTGVGNMLLVDGSPTPGTSFWCQTIPVTPNTDYAFTAWVTPAFLPLPSIQVSINGVASAPFAPLPIIGTWSKIKVAWNSGVNTSATICMEDLNTAFFGNAFAIDDIALQEVCTANDSTFVNAIVPDTNSISTDTIVCFSPGNSTTITAPAGYTSYIWNVGGTTNTLMVSTGTYWVFATIGCSTLIDTFHVIVLNDTFNLYNIDTAICRGVPPIQVRITGNTTLNYQWTPTAGIRFPNTMNPEIDADTSAMYTLTASIDGCPDVVDSFYIDVQPVPKVFAGGSRVVCEFDTLHLNVTVVPNWYKFYTYSWTPVTNIDDPTMPTIVFNAGDTTTYTVTVTTPNGCTGVDSALIVVFPGNFAYFDTSVSLCPGDSVQLIPTGGTGYRWTPGLYLDDSTSASPWVHPITSLQYRLIASEIHGCTDTMWADIQVYPNAVITLGDSVTIHHGESYQLNPQTNCTSFSWFPAAGLDNRYASNPIASPDADTRYIVQGITQWGCKAVDTFCIYIGETVLAVPNAFVPGNGPNGRLQIIKRGTATLNYFRIYNRWGNLVFESTDINEGWDGMYNGKPQPFGVFVYEVEAVTLTGKTFRKHGNVTLLR